MTANSWMESEEIGMIVKECVKKCKNFFLKSRFSLCCHRGAPWWRGGPSWSTPRQVLLSDPWRNSCGAPLDIDSKLLLSANQRSKTWRAADDKAFRVWRLVSWEQRRRVWSPVEAQGNRLTAQRKDSWNAFNRACFTRGSAEVLRGAKSTQLSGGQSVTHSHEHESSIWAAITCQQFTAEQVQSAAAQLSLVLHRFTLNATMTQIFLSCSRQPPVSENYQRLSWSVGHQEDLTET